MPDGKRPKTGGRAAGTPNKATAEARQAIALFVDKNAHRLSEWLDRVAEENPAKAFELFQSVVEYHVPKLARTEMVGDGGGPIQTEDVRRPKLTKEEWMMAHGVGAAAGSTK